MKSIKKYIVVSPILLCLLVSTCTPFIASASTADVVYDFPIQEPQFGDYSGYVVLTRADSPSFIPTSSNNYATVLFWVLTPVVEDNTIDRPTVSCTLTRDRFNIIVATGEQNVAYYLTVWYMHNSDTSGTTYILYSDLINYSSAFNYTINAPTGTQFLNPHFKGVTSFDISNINRNYNTAVSWSNTSLVLDELYSIYYQLTAIVYDLDLSYAQLQEFYSFVSDYLSKINRNINSITALVDQFYYEWYQWSWTEQGFYERIIELLEQAIEGEKPPNQDSMQDSYDDYADIEQDLINNEEASNAIGNFDVTIEGGAYSVIWNMITDFLNSNSKVFGLFIACLTLAFIALLLHR